MSFHPSVPWDGDYDMVKDSKSLPNSGSGEQIITKLIFSASKFRYSTKKCHNTPIRFLEPILGIYDSDRLKPIQNNK
ncbi:hypothetical protein Xkoz_01503 [Xenorhabdus kozodoii]|uniref:Uncharacterized protein n=1 Tax=Xenorhabdus kozodoii TaxID=351676 RepID=A0A2D0LDD4_9GAMM|nr:hypothetical protein Xkoz_01503 [Xenorhabdus kozodoii]